MRPQDLPIFFSWEERKPLLQEGLLCIPRQYQDHNQFDFCWKEIFKNNNPIAVEFCSGNGEWIARAATLYPEYNWIGVEKQFMRTRQIWSKKQNLGLHNLLPVCGMAEDFCAYYMKNSQIAKAYVNFPDPWPKQRHAKHRLIQTPFIDLLTKISQDGAELTLVTDDQKYAEQMKRVLATHASWGLIEDGPLPENYGPSYFYRLWQSLEKTTKYMRFACGR